MMILFKTIKKRLGPIKEKIFRIPLDYPYPIRILLYRMVSTVFYKFKKINPAIWSSGDLKKLLQNNYKPEYRVNKMAFVCSSPQTFEHAENILFYLDKNEYDVIIIPIGVPEYETILYKKAKKYQCGALTIREVFEKKLSYKVAVSCLYDSVPTGFVYNNGKLVLGAELIAGKVVRVVSTIHGSKYQFCKNRNLLYDYIICMGNFHKQRYETLGLKAKLFVLGSPRFDKNEKPMEIDKAILHNLHLDNKKKTILWLPVHYRYTSLFDFMPLVTKIKNDFNIIIKPHPALYHEISNLDALIASLLPEAIIIKDIANVKLFPLVDFVICDYGGSIFTALKADKNVFFFNTKRTYLLKGPLGLDSPEIELRDRIINFNQEDEKDFIAALHSDKIWEAQKEIRKQIRDEFFTENEHAAEDIANLLRKIVKDEI